MQCLTLFYSKTVKEVALKITQGGENFLLNSSLLFKAILTTVEIAFFCYSENFRVIILNLQLLYIIIFPLYCHEIVRMSQKAIFAS